jgi:hypothetical protein
MRARPMVQSLLVAVALHSSGVLRAADVIFDNGASNQDDGWEMTQYFESDDFVVAERTQLSAVKFWNYARSGAFTGTISWDICADRANSPGGLVATGSSSPAEHSYTGFSLFGTLFEAVTTFHISPVTLDPGTYWLALHNGPRNYVTRGMFWAPTGKRKTSGTPSHSRETLSTGPWYSNDYPGMSPDLAFQVFGAVVPKALGTAFVNGVPTVRFTSKAGKQYRLEYKNNLSDAAWTVVPGREAITGTGGEMQVDDPQPNAGRAARRFYRVSVL